MFNEQKHAAVSHTRLGVLKNLFLMVQVLFTFRAVVVFLPTTTEFYKAAIYGINVTSISEGKYKAQNCVVVQWCTGILFTMSSTEIR
jgi:hypothetical protein